MGWVDPLPPQMGPKTGWTANHHHWIWEKQQSWKEMSEKASCVTTVHRFWQEESSCGEIWAENLKLKLQFEAWQAQSSSHNHEREILHVCFTNNNNTHFQSFNKSLNIRTFSFYSKLLWREILFFFPDLTAADTYKAIYLTFNIHFSLEQKHQTTAARRLQGRHAGNKLIFFSWSYKKHFYKYIDKGFFYISNIYINRSWKKIWALWQKCKKVRGRI